MSNDASNVQAVAPRGPEAPPVLRYVKRSLAVAAAVVGIVAALDIPSLVSGMSLFSQQYLALFWGLVTALVFLSTPASKKARAATKWYDWALAGLSLIVGLYVTICYPKLLPTLGLLSTTRVVLGGIAVLMVLESLRRLTGWPLVVIVLLFILYGRFAHIFSGPLQGTGIPLPRLISQLFLGADFMFGSPLKIAVLVVFAFVLFGQYLFVTRGGDFFLDLAQAALGRQRGGAAKTTLVAGALFGTISGSAVASVASVGVVTLPMMKKAGYPPDFAAGVQAVAGTGGCIMPPVMGAAAFVMAEFLNVPYAVVAIAAALPAVFYYLSAFFQVHFWAQRTGLEGLSPGEVPPVRRTIVAGWPFLLPIVVLVYTLFALAWRPELSALAATATLLAVGVLRKDVRRKLSLGSLVEGLEGATKGLLEITATCAGAGMIVGVVGYTGLAFSLSAVLTQLSGGHLLVLAILTAVVSSILGMGMPVTACYILLAALAAPAMVQLGVDPLLAHLFIFYFGTFSFLTPPVCLAVYAASSMAGAPMLATAGKAIRLALVGYLVPFMFLYKPGLVLHGSTPEIVLAVFEGLGATVLLAAGLEGYLRRPLWMGERIALMSAALLIFAPLWQTTLIGLILAIVVFVLQWTLGKRASFLTG